MVQAPSPSAPQPIPQFLRSPSVYSSTFGTVISTGEIIARFHELYNLRHPNLPVYLEVIANHKERLFLFSSVHGPSLRAILEAQGVERPGAEESRERGGEGSRVISPPGFRGVKRLSGGAEESRCLLDEEAILEICYQVTKGVEYLHATSLVHRGISPDSIQIAADGQVLLSDYGVFTLTRSAAEVDFFWGDLAFSAPEVFLEGDTGASSTPVDIWSIGALLLYLFRGSLPWANLSSSRSTEVIEGVWRFAGWLPESAYQSIKRPTSLHQFAKELLGMEGSNCSFEAARVMHLCLSSSPSTRPGATKLLQNPFQLRFKEPARLKEWVSELRLRGLQGSVAGRRKSSGAEELGEAAGLKVSGSKRQTLLRVLRTWKDSESSASQSLQASAPPTLNFLDAEIGANTQPLGPQAPQWETMPLMLWLKAGIPTRAEGWKGHGGEGLRALDLKSSGGDEQLEHSAANGLRGLEAIRLGTSRAEGVDGISVTCAASGGTSGAQGAQCDHAPAHSRASSLPEHHDPSQSQTCSATRARNLAASEMEELRVRLRDLLFCWIAGGADLQGEMMRDSGKWQWSSIHSFPTTSTQISSATQPYQNWVFSVALGELETLIQTGPRGFGSLGIRVSQSPGLDAKQISNIQNLYLGQAPFASDSGTDGLKDLRDCGISRIHRFRELFSQGNAGKAKIWVEARLGIPPPVRAQVWIRILDLDIEHYRKQFQDLKGGFKCPGETMKQIEKDIPRCHAYDCLLSSQAGQAKLRRVLGSWCAYNPSKTYWQGVDALAAPLVLLNFGDEAAAFGCLHQVIERHLPNVFAADSLQVTALNGMLGLFQRLLAFLDPELFTHLKSIDLTPDLFAIPWLMTWFSHLLPLESLFLLWDRLLLGHPALPIFFAVYLVIGQRGGLVDESFEDCFSALTQSLSNSVLSSRQSVEECIEAAQASLLITPASILSGNTVGLHQRETTPAEIVGELSLGDYQSLISKGMLYVIDTSSDGSFSADEEGISFNVPNGQMDEASQLVSGLDALRGSTIAVTGPQESLNRRFAEILLVEHQLPCVCLLPWQSLQTRQSKTEEQHDNPSATETLGEPVGSLSLVHSQSLTLGHGQNHLSMGSEQKPATAHNQGSWNPPDSPLGADASPNRSSSPKKLFSVPSWDFSESQHSSDDLSSEAQAAGDMDGLKGQAPDRLRGLNSPASSNSSRSKWRYHPQSWSWGGGRNAWQLGAKLSAPGPSTTTASSNSSSDQAGQLPGPQPHDSKHPSYHKMLSDSDLEDLHRQERVEAMAEASGMRKDKITEHTSNIPFHSEVLSLQKRMPLHDVQEEHASEISPVPQSPNTQRPNPSGPNPSGLNRSSNVSFNTLSEETQASLAAEPSAVMGASSSAAQTEGSGTESKKSTEGEPAKEAKSAGGWGLNVLSKGAQLGKKLLDSLPND